MDQVYASNITSKNSTNQAINSSMNILHGKIMKTSGNNHLHAWKQDPAQENNYTKIITLAHKITEKCYF